VDRPLADRARRAAPSGVRRDLRPGGVGGPALPPARHLPLPGLARRRGGVRLAAVGLLPQPGHPAAQRPDPGRGGEHDQLPHRRAELDPGGHRPGRRQRGAEPGRDRADPAAAARGLAPAKAHRPGDLGALRHQRGRGRGRARPGRPGRHLQPGLLAAGRRLDPAQRHQRLRLRRPGAADRRHRPARPAPTPHPRARAGPGRAHLLPGLRGGVRPGRRPAPGLPGAAAVDVVLAALLHHRGGRARLVRRRGRPHSDPHRPRPLRRHLPRHPRAAGPGLRGDRRAGRLGAGPAPRRAPGTDPAAAPRATSWPR
jgi:hypothetical protein